MENEGTLVDQANPIILESTPSTPQEQTSYPEAVNFPSTGDQPSIHEDDDNPYEFESIQQLSRGIGDGRELLESGFFFRLHAARKHQKKFPCYKRYKNSRIFLDEKAKCQPWIIKIWMKKPKLDENRIKIGENFILHP
jgi:hypothetical protein